MKRFSVKPNISFLNGTTIFGPEHSLRNTNEGHAGRPGHVGGSAPKGTSSSEVASIEAKTKGWTPHDFFDARHPSKEPVSAQVQKSGLAKDATEFASERNSTHPADHVGGYANFTAASVAHAEAAEAQTAAGNADQAKFHQSESQRLSDIAESHRDQPKTPSNPYANHDAAYVANENARHQKHIQQIETAPLSERQEGAKDYAARIRNHPEQVGENASMLLHGHYGYGAGKEAHDVVSSPRMNHAAFLGQRLAQLDHGADSRMARNEYNKLSQTQRNTLDGHLKKAVDEYKSSLVNSTGKRSLLMNSWSDAAREASAQKRKQLMREYNKLPVTHSPQDHLKSLGNWGLTEEENKKATSIAKQLQKIK